MPTPLSSAVERARFYRKFGRRYWRETRAADPRMPVHRFARYVLQGFHPLEGSWYEQSYGRTDVCVSNFHREVGLSRINRHYGYLLDNKLFFAQSVKAAGLPQPEVFGAAHHGRWYWEPDGLVRLQRSIDERGRAMVKPITGKKGREIEAIDDPRQLFDRSFDEVLVTAFCRQADYAQRIYPGSLNTVRLLSLLPRDGEFFIGAAIHRFGAEGTGLVDNFSSGGLVADIDLATGRIGRAVRVGPDNRLLWYDRHPDTDAAISGVTVERWAEVKRLTLELCRAFPFLKYVGWDIAVTPDGPEVIEGNAHPGLRFFQIYEPLLANDRMRDFYKDYFR
jgi:hypothetical protein